MKQQKIGLKNLVDDLERLRQVSIEFGKILEVLLSKIQTTESVEVEEETENQSWKVRVFRLKYTGKCSVCGVKLRKGWSAYWDPATNKLYCTKHKSL